jgi:hypothetical protein
LPSTAIAKSCSSGVGNRSTARSYEGYAPGRWQSSPDHLGGSSRERTRAAAGFGGFDRRSCRSRRARGVRTFARAAGVPIDAGLCHPRQSRCARVAARSVPRRRRIFATVNPSVSSRRSPIAGSQIDTILCCRPSKIIPTNGANTTPKTQCGSGHCACTKSASSNRAHRRSSPKVRIGASYELEVLRRGSGRPLLVLHGFSTIERLLGRHAEIVTPSSPGFGHSRRPENAYCRNGRHPNDVSRPII